MGTYRTTDQSLDELNLVIRDGQRIGLFDQRLPRNARGRHSAVVGTIVGEIGERDRNPYISTPRRRLLLTKLDVVTAYPDEDKGEFLSTDALHEGTVIPFNIGDYETIIIGEHADLERSRRETRQRCFHHNTEYQDMYGNTRDAWRNFNLPDQWDDYRMLGEIIDHLLIEPFRTAGRQIARPYHATKRVLKKVA